MGVTTEGNGITWRCPSNIAIVKYWGKRDFQLPRNPSISITLNKSFTETNLTYTRKKDANKGIDFDFLFEGSKQPGFEAKISSLLKKAEPYMDFLHDFSLVIKSSNSFPHSSGIASSASSMGALALCLCSMEMELTSNISGFDSFEQKVTFLSRLGSGSASRSVFGGYVLWGECKQIPGSSDEFAMPLPILIHESFMEMCDAVLIVSSGTKAVSSSEGHKLMDVNPYSGVRYNVAKTNIALLLEAFATGDEDLFVKITEDEALHLHAMFMTSSPGYILAQPGTIEIIHKIRRFRKETGLFVCFTLDAGPNVHLLYPKSIQSEIHKFIRNELQQHCENGSWIDDEIGCGPVRV